MQFLSEGYAIHLSSLQFGHQFRSQKTASMRMMLRNSSFGLSTKPDFLPKRTLLRRTMSVQPAELPKTLIPKPERSQSQPEYDKEHKFGGGMFVLGGMHFGNTTPWPQRVRRRDKRREQCPGKPLLWCIGSYITVKIGCWLNWVLFMICLHYSMMRKCLQIVRYLNWKVHVYFPKQGH